MSYARQIFGNDLDLWPIPLGVTREEDNVMYRSQQLTLLDLIQAVSEVAANDQELLVTVADLINSGQVRFCGDAAGATIDLLATNAAA
jgi:hypothetical protein